MKKGIVSVIIYYVVGFLATVLSYWAFDHSYAHGPSFYHMVALLTFFGGIFWTLKVILQFLFIDRNDKRAGIIVTNIVILTGLFLTFYLAIVNSK